MVDKKENYKFDLGVKGLSKLLLLKRGTVNKKCKDERLKEEVYFLLIGSREFTTEWGRLFRT